MYGVRRERSETIITWTPEAAEKGGYEHFMLKEIHEQPESLAPGDRRPGRPGPTTSGSRSSRGSRRRSGRSTASSWSPAARRSTPSLVGARRSRTGSGSRPGRRSAPSSATARRRSTGGRSSSRSPSPARRPTRSRRPGWRAERGAPVIAVTNTVGSAITREADRGPVPAGRPGDRGRRVQDVRHPGDHAGDPRRGDRQGARHARRRARAGRSGARCARCPAGAARALENASRDRRAGAALRQLARVHVRRPRRLVPGGAGGRAQAQGGQLRPRRGLRGRRAQARSDLAARRRVPAGRGRHPLGASTTS